MDKVDMVDEVNKVDRVEMVDMDKLDKNKVDNDKVGKTDISSKFTQMALLENSN